MFTAILHENRKTLALAAPIIAGQVGQMLMGLADTLMVGHLGVVPLAACAFANTILSVAFVFGFGLMSAVTVQSSQAFGAGRGTGKVYRAGFVLGGAVGMTLTATLLALIPVLHLFGQPPEVNREVVGFLVLVAISVGFSMVFTAVKNFAESLSRPWPPFWIVLGSVGLNVGLNFLFIFGLLGFPAMGLTGAGLATLLARVAALAALLLWIHGSAYFRPYLAAQADERSLGRELRAMLRVGLPAGGQLLAEVGAFATASLMMGWIGVNALAAHQIAITCAALTFMVPLGIGMAVTVRVGQSYGGGKFARVRPIAFGGLGMAGGVMMVTATIFVLFSAAIAGLFVRDPAVTVTAAALIMVAGIFQIVDGAQVVALNALRGLGDVHVPMGIAVVSYWVIALPVAYSLAFPFGLGPVGVWVGLAVGLLVASVALIARFAWKSVPARLSALAPAVAH